MFPRERSLAAGHRDEPFALIGVNSDPIEVARKAVADEKLEWRHFWDGGGTSGPIAARWNVHAWPTIYVLDGHGVIRAKNLRDVELERKVRELLAEPKGPGG